MQEFYPDTYFDDYYMPPITNSNKSPEANYDDPQVKKRQQGKVIPFGKPRRDYRDTIIRFILRLLKWMRV